MGTAPDWTIGGYPYSFCLRGSTCHSFHVGRAPSDHYPQPILMFKQLPKVHCPVVLWALLPTLNHYHPDPGGFGRPALVPADRHRIPYGTGVPYSRPQVVLADARTNPGGRASGAASPGGQAAAAALRRGGGVAVGAFVLPNAPIEPRTPLSAYVVPLDDLEQVGWSRSPFLIPYSMSRCEDAASTAQVVLLPAAGPSGII